MRSKPTYWDKVRKELRPKFANAGLLNVCELGWEGCQKDKFLSFAHSLRRRKIDSYKKHDPEMYEKLMREVIRACSVPCHASLDSRDHNETAEIVRAVIKARKKPVV